jgi:hypothetical protein
MPYGYTKPQQIGTDIWKDKGPEISPYHIEWGMSESILLAMVQWQPETFGNNWKPLLQKIQGYALMLTPAGHSTSLFLFLLNGLKYVISRCLQKHKIARHPAQHFEDSMTNKENAIYR